ncbi:hypothetical protein HAX54_050837, partial [Datura stramonium]|nr:hypothetical protein [Datura stramonium]
EDTKHVVHFYSGSNLSRTTVKALPRNLDLICDDWGFDISALEDVHAKNEPVGETTLAGKKPEDAGASYKRIGSKTHMDGQKSNNSFNLKISPSLCTADKSSKGKDIFQGDRSRSSNSAPSSAPITYNNYYKTNQRRGPRIKKARTGRSKESTLLK